MKNLFVSIVFIVAAITSVSLLWSNSANAAGGGSATDNDTAAATATCPGDDPGFLSFPTWYRGLPCDSNNKIDIKGGEIGSIIFTIALNVLDILLRLVGILAVGFVIYGGIRYITSNGEPEKAKQALDTILKAVIGMVIAMIAAVVVSFIVSGQGTGRLSHYVSEGARLPSLCPYAHGRKPRGPCDCAQGDRRVWC